MGHFRKGWMSLREMEEWEAVVRLLTEGRVRNTVRRQRRDWSLARPRTFPIRGRWPLRTPAALVGLKRLKRRR